MAPHISVIVLGYNGLKYLDACLSSVLDQELPRGDYEVLFVDNASTDGSAGFVRERFPEVRVVELERNYGFAEGMNRGVREAGGRYLALLNQDTVCHRRWLRELVAALDARPEALAAHSNVLTPWCPGYEQRDREGQPPIVQVPELTRFGFVAYKLRPFSPEPFETLFLGGAALMVRREAVERLRYLFDPEFFAYCEDTDLALRLANAGAPVLLAPASVVYHDLTPSTALGWAALRKTLLILRNRALAFYKNMGWLELLAFLPWLVAGAPLKPGELRLGRLRGVLYGLGTLPLIPVALLWAAVTAPKVASRRADTLRERTLAPFELLRALRRGGPVEHAATRV